MKENLKLQRDGLLLDGLLETPDLAADENCPLAIIMHGFNTSSRQHPFYRLTRQLLEKGIATLRFDFSCHGRSEGDMAQMTVEQLIEDAETFYAYAKKLSFVSEIYLVGYSLGGVIASHIAVRHKEEVSKLVLFSPAADIQRRAKAGFFFGNLYDPDDPPEVIETKQFRIGRPYFLSAPNVVVYDHLKEFDKPALLVFGEADQYVPREDTLQYAEVLKDLKVVPIPDAGHLWEVNYKIAVKAIVDFL